MDIRKKVLLLTLLMLILTALVGLRFVYQPRTLKLGALLEQLNEEYEKNRIFFEINKLQEKTASYSERFLRSEKDLPWLLDKISQIFNGLKLQIVSMEPQTPEKFSFYTRIPVKIKTVCSYHKLGELVSSLENLRKFVDIDYIELKSLKFIQQNLEKDAKGKTQGLRSLFDERGNVLAEIILKVSSLYLD